jgi:aminopeptidase N
VEVGADGAAVDRTIHLDEVSRSYDVDITGAPRTLAIDPDFRLFRRLDAVEIPPILREVAFDPGGVAIVAASDPAARTAAGELAASFFERQPEVHAADAALPPRAALLVGTTKEVTALLTRAQVETAPPDLAGKGTARAWAVRRPDHTPLAIVAADDAGALRAIVRPLPHYGGQSFVVFRGSEAVEKGLWPQGPSPLRVTLGIDLPTRSPR